MYSSGPTGNGIVRGANPKKFNGTNRAVVCPRGPESLPASGGKKIATVR
jgi:hypothetical protein